jgi:hypothetical protein
MKHIQSISIFETEKAGHVDMKKLEQYALGIELCCNGEYGAVFFNKDTEAVFVCLGDSHPFDESYLKEFMTDAIKKSYDDYDKIDIQIENETYPDEAEAGWMVFSHGAFKPWTGKF